jgi:hypothetical protein
LLCSKNWKKYSISGTLWWIFLFFFPNHFFLVEKSKKKIFNYLIIFLNFSTHHLGSKIIQYEPTQKWVKTWKNEKLFWVILKKYQLWTIVKRKVQKISYKFSMASLCDFSNLFKNGVFCNFHRKITFFQKVSTLQKIT